MQEKRKEEIGSVTSTQCKWESLMKEAGRKAGRSEQCKKVLAKCPAALREMRAPTALSWCPCCAQPLAGDSLCEVWSWTQGSVDSRGKDQLVRFASGLRSMSYNSRDCSSHQRCPWEMCHAWPALFHMVILLGVTRPPPISSQGNGARCHLGMHVLNSK